MLQKNIFYKNGYNSISLVWYALQTRRILINFLHTFLVLKTIIQKILIGGRLFRLKKI